MISLASLLPRRVMVSQCTAWITRQDVHARLKHAKSQRKKKSLICSEGEPTLLSIGTRKEIEAAASHALPGQGVDRHLAARR
jgi:hypothetical protein